MSVVLFISVLKPASSYSSGYRLSSISPATTLTSPPYSTSIATSLETPSKSTPSVSVDLDAAAAAPSKRRNAVAVFLTNTDNQAVIESALRAFCETGELSLVEVVHVPMGRMPCLMYTVRRLNLRSDITATTDCKITGSALTRPAAGVVDEVAPSLTPGPPELSGVDIALCSGSNRGSNSEANGVGLLAGGICNSGVKHNERYRSNNNWKAQQLAHRPPLRFVWDLQVK